MSEELPLAALTRRGGPIEDGRASTEGSWQWQIRHAARSVADLEERLTLTDEELEKLSEMFSQTLSTIDTLKELDTSSVDETYQVTGLTNVFQKESESKATLEQKEVLSNAKEQTRGLFSTDAVFDRE